jgi:hypothetical protein
MGEGKKNRHKIDTLMLVAMDSISTLPSNGWRVVLASMFYRIGISYVG